MKSSSKQVELAVGTIIETMGKPDATKWRKCEGAKGESLDPVEYPEYAAIYPDLYSTSVFKDSVLALPNPGNAQGYVNSGYGCKLYHDLYALMARGIGVNDKRLVMEGKNIFKGTTTTLDYINNENAWSHYGGGYATLSVIFDMQESYYAVLWSHLTGYANHSEGYYHKDYALGVLLRTKEKGVIVNTIISTYYAPSKPPSSIVYSVSEIKYMDPYLWVVYTDNGPARIGRFDTGSDNPNSIQIFDGSSIYGTGFGCAGFTDDNRMVAIVQSGSSRLLKVSYPGDPTRVQSTVSLRTSDIWTFRVLGNLFVAVYTKTSGTQNVIEEVYEISDTITKKVGHTNTPYTYNSNHAPIVVGLIEEDIWVTYYNGSTSKFVLAVCKKSENYSTVRFYDYEKYVTNTDDANLIAISPDPHRYYTFYRTIDRAYGYYSTPIKVSSDAFTTCYIKVK